MRVLIVEDDQQVQQILSASLEVHHFETVVAPDPLKALEVLSVAEVDAVILDLMMPYLHGYDFLEILRCDPRTQHLPVLIVTGLDEGEQQERGFDLGADGFLVKPFDPAELVVHLRSILNGQSSSPKGTIVGEISRDGLIAILKDLERGRWSGYVHLKVEPRHGRLEILKGRTVAASFGLLEGPDAMLEVLGLQEGIFVIDASLTPDTPESLAADMELLTMEDELASLASNLETVLRYLPGRDASLFVAQEAEPRDPRTENIPYSEIYLRIETLPGLTLEELESQDFAPSVKVRLAVASLIEHGILKATDAHGRTWENRADETSA